MYIYKENIAKAIKYLQTNDDGQDQLTILEHMRKSFYNKTTFPLKGYIIIDQFHFKTQILYDID